MVYKVSILAVLLHYSTLLQFTLHNNQPLNNAISSFHKTDSTMPFGRTSKLGTARPTKKVKIEGIAKALAAVAIPDYRDYENDDKSFEFHSENKLEDPQDYIEFLAELSEPLLKDDCFRKTVALLFFTEFDTIDNTQNAWIGKSGILLKIRDQLRLNSTTKVNHMLNDVLACKQAGISYD
jgi:hypothetical protein